MVASTLRRGAGINFRLGPANLHGAGGDAPSSYIARHHAESRAKFARCNVKHSVKSSEVFRHLWAMMKEKGAIMGNTVAHLLQEVA